MTPCWLGDKWMDYFHSVGVCLYSEEVAQSCLTLCDSMDCSLPGSSIHGILEWAASSFSRGSSQPRNRTWVSRTVGTLFTVWATRAVPNVLVKAELSGPRHTCNAAGWGCRRRKEMQKPNQGVLTSRVKESKQVLLRECIRIVLRWSRGWHSLCLYPL